MVNYTCEICSKNFNRKSNFDYHINNKKKPCQIIPHKTTQNHTTPTQNHTTPTQTNIKQNNKQEDQKLVVNIIQKPIKNIQDSQKEKKTIHHCAYCSLGFTRKDALKRHIDKYCKVKILDNEHKEKTFELLIKENQDIKKELEEIKKQMEKQINKVQTQNINKGHITNNNIIIPQAKLADFGSEDYEKINLKKILNSIKDSGVNGIINCFNDIHYNEEIPQYKNVFITDKSRDKGMVYEGGQWRVKTIKYIVGEIITHIERYIRIIEKRIRTGQYKDMIDPEDPDKKKKLNIKEFKETMEQRLKKYILRYYGDDEETTPTDSKKFYNMVMKYVSNRLFDIKDNVYRHYEKVIEDINKDLEESADPEIKEIKEEKKQIIQELDKLTKADIEAEKNSSDNDSNDSDDEDLEDLDDGFEYREVTLASGLKIMKWCKKNLDYKDSFNF